MDCSTAGFPVHHQLPEPSISSSVFPFSSRLQSFPASGSFQISQFFTSGGWSIGASASVLPINIQDRYPLGDWITLQSNRLSRIFSNTTVQKHQFFSTHLFIVQFSHLYMTTVKTIALTRWTFVGKVMSLLFNMLSRIEHKYLQTCTCWDPSSLAIPWVVKSQALGQKFPANGAVYMSGKIWNQMKSFLMV